MNVHKIANIALIIGDMLSKEGISITLVLAAKIAERINLEITNDNQNNK